MPSHQQLLDVITIQTEIAALGLDLAGVMQLVVDRTLELMQAHGAAIELAEGEDMVYRATSGTTTPMIGMRLKKANSLSGLCVLTGQPLRCDDSDIDTRVDREACRKVGLRSMLVMPLRHGNDTIGVLKAMSETPHHFNPAHELLLGLLSGVVGAAMYFSSKYSRDDLFFRATHDGLTGLANRGLFADRLLSNLQRCVRDEVGGAVLMIDLDRFKAINDTWGHGAGDAALKAVAVRLVEAARATDLVARLGGDEFAVLLTPLPDPTHLPAVIARFVQVVEQPFAWEGHDIPLRLSIGPAHYPTDGSDREALLAQADARMYVNKQERRGSGTSPSGKRTAVTATAA